MNGQTTETAYAKINYMLHIGGKRDDGFHDILTLMQTVSLTDTIEVAVSAGAGISLSVIGDAQVPVDSRNLAWRAARIFLDRLGSGAHIDIILHKHIPIAGGLAGGSADAAAVLRALNRIYDMPFTTEELMTLAGELGSDIPFCVCGGLALCAGRGERVKKLDAPEGQRHFLIVNRGEHVSTAEAYALADARMTIPAPRDTSKDCLAALEGDLTGLQAYLYNDFESCILPLCPLVAEAKEDLLRTGAVAVLMSGSGSTVYGVYDNREAARAAQGKLPYHSYYATDVFV